MDPTPVGSFLASLGTTGVAKPMKLRPGLGDVVVFVNLSPHLASGVATAIKQAWAEVPRLSSHGLDCTPTEELWLKAKQFLLRAAA